MALNIQNDLGTTVDANSYVDGAYYVAYMADRGITIAYTTVEEIAQVDASLIQATSYIDTANSYCGEKLNGRDQTTAFPRSPLYDDGGYSVEGVPREIKEAQCEYAYIYTEQGTLQPNQNINGSVKRTKEVTDVIEEEVEYTGSGQTGGKISYPIADNKIPKAFICAGSDGYFVRA